ncbi:hypothetical protein pb186bvf_014371 [Paramecium bursaria]
MQGPKSKLMTQYFLLRYLLFQTFLISQGPKNLIVPCQKLPIVNANISSNKVSGVLSFSENINFIQVQLEEIWQVRVIVSYKVIFIGQQQLTI